MSNPKPKTETTGKTPVTQAVGAATEVPTEKPILPVKPSEFGLAQHQYRVYNAFVPVGMGKKDLARAGLWDHVAAQLQMFDEVRAVAEDGSWVATLIVTFKHANKVLLAVTGFTVLEKISYEEQSGLNKYTVKQRGVKKWCIIDNSDGTVVDELIPTQSEAYGKLDSLLASLNR
jgi:hypothetical protein